MNNTIVIVGVLFMSFWIAAAIFLHLPLLTVTPGIVLGLVIVLAGIEGDE